MKSWAYHGKEITTEDIPEAAIGFLYVITNKIDGKRYIGKKLLTKAATKTINGKKKKIRKESDWRDYWSSSPWLQEIIEKEGKDNFQRKIVCFAFSKGELNYQEECAQYQLRVLESDDWYNSNIRSRIFKRTVQKYNLDDFYQAIRLYKPICYSSSASSSSSSTSSSVPQQGQ